MSPRTKVKPSTPSSEAGCRHRSARRARPAARADGARGDAHEVGADEPGAAGDQELHGCIAFVCAKLISRSCRANQPRPRPRHHCAVVVAAAIGRLRQQLLGLLPLLQRQRAAPDRRRVACAPRPGRRASDERARRRGAARRRRGAAWPGGERRFGAGAVAGAGERLDARRQNDSDEVRLGQAALPRPAMIAPARPASASFTRRTNAGSRSSAASTARRAASVARAWRRPMA